MENYSNTSLRVLTIGHSNHQVEHFLDLLKSHSVQVVADTRSYLYSEYATQFDQKPLKMAPEADGIRYVFLGRELGGRPDGDEFYDDQGHVLYDRVAETELFQEGVLRLERGNPRIQGGHAVCGGKSSRLSQTPAHRARPDKPRNSSGPHPRR